MGYAPITAVATGVTAFVGRCGQGPVDVAVPIGGPVEAAERLGPPRVHGDLAHCLELFFANGGERAYAIRVDAPEGGATGEVDRAALIGSGERRTGLHAVSDIDDVDVLCIPDVAQLASGDAAAVYGVAAEICETQRAMLLVDPPDRIDDPAHVVAWADASGIRGRNAAMYVPRLLVEDPQEPGRSRPLAPSPAIAGVYARTDALRAVWSAPAGAGAQLRGIHGLRTQVTRMDQDLLLPAGINTLRRFVGHGPLVWGARTLETAATDVEWRYVAVRRFALFVERSLQQGLWWMAEEANTAATWALVRGAVERFLLGLWRQGAFPASRPDQAFYVRCGLGATMTEEDVDAGRLVVELGLAPTRPAEFVALRLPFAAGDPSPGSRPEAPSPGGPSGPSPERRRGDRSPATDRSGVRPGRAVEREVEAGTRVVVAGGSSRQHGHATQVLAEGLGEAVHRIDLRQVISRYIGETEKNLDRIFAAAASTGTVLLFDEADAVFARRSTSTGANDALEDDDALLDGEVELLLGKLAAHPGVVVLATADPAAARDRPRSLRAADVVEFDLDDR